MPYRDALAQTQMHAPRLLSLLLAAVLLTLSACESTPGGGSSIAATRAERLLAAGDYERAAVQYMQLAGNTAGTQRDRFLLGAAEAWIGQGDPERVNAILSQVTDPSAPDIAADWAIANAGLANLVGDGNGALEALAGVDIATVSLDTRIRAEGVRATALFLANQPSAALRVLQQRELWLSNAREIAANDQLAWEGLLQSDPIVLQQALDDTADPVLSGWLSLGLLAEGGSAGALQRGLTNWRRRFPGHPAMRNVVTGFDATAGEASVPQRIALLLTLSGRSQVVGQAVRDGFLSHYANRFGNSLDAPAISIYDIADVGATRAYQLALDEGAQFIVGPLLPSAAAELASYSEPQVPSLLLNYPETTARSTPPDATADDLVPALGTERIDPGAAGWMRFGLAPEDEAAAAAARAYADGHRRALALVPSSRWGERVLKAFNSRFVELGGEVMAYEQYIATETDYSNEIERLMLLTDSVARYRRMRSLLGGSLQFEPRRRADSDLIFMAANADSGRRLKPQFRFHYAGDLPVYATANVHEVNRRQPDSDLNGVQFTDIAWLVDGFKGLGTPLAGARRDLATAQSQPRLFALGYDAFEILLRLHDAEKNPRRPFAGATGTLRLEEDGAVRRAPPWAQFERGRPVALPDAPLPASWMELPDDNAASIRLPRR